MEKEKQLDSNQVESLKDKLAKQMQGLLLMSETDAPVEAISFTSIDDIKQKLIAESAEPQPVLTELDFDEFLDKYTTVYDWYNSIQKNFADKFGGALRLMQEQLLGVKVFRVGGVKANIYILGRSSGSDWLGLKTLVVET